MTPGTDVQKAAEILRQGGLVAFPTETVYGLGADAMNAKAVCRVFEVKKRPEFDPLIVHVSSWEQAVSLWEAAKTDLLLAQKLAEHFWPGPLTIVLPKNPKVPDVVTAGLSTVAVRMPQHEMALAFLKAFGGPVAAPSANVFGYASATTAEAVREDFGDGVDFILDAGRSPIGVESTVVKIEEGRLKILRPGGITQEELSKFAPVDGVRPDSAHPESPGQMASHYAPYTPLALMDCSLGQFLKKLESVSPLPRIGLLLFSKNVNTPLAETTAVLSEKKDLSEAATNLFQAIRKLDKMHLDWIAAEPVPEEGIGVAIMDRLKKASGGKFVFKDLLRDHDVDANKT